jgi:3-hydroxyisobutyrate dehydrogenase
LTTLHAFPPEERVEQILLASPKPTGLNAHYGISAFSQGILREFAAQRRTIIRKAGVLHKFLACPSEVPGQLWHSRRRTASAKTAALSPGASTMAKVAFLGLGVMGYPMARHLKAKGHAVTVYNRTFAKAEKWVAEHDGVAAKTPAQAAKGQEFVFACVGNDDDLRSVTLGVDGAFAGMARGAVFIDHTTASANVARELHAAAKADGIGFIDAPVSGGQAGAENGVLTVMCGGEADVFAKAEPVIMSFARACRLLGAPGAGQIAKMMNQIAIAGLVQGLSEAVHFGRKAGMDVDAVIDVISKGAAGSWQMENRAKTMNQMKFDFGFAVDWMRKDLGICLDEARTNGATLPVTALVDQFYAEVQKMGGRRWDTSSLVARLEK